MEDEEESHFGHSWRGPMVESKHHVSVRSSLKSGGWVPQHLDISPLLETVFGGFTQRHLATHHPRITFDQVTTVEEHYPMVVKRPQCGDRLKNRLSDKLVGHRTATSLADRFVELKTHRRQSPPGDGEREPTQHLGGKTPVEKTQPLHCEGAPSGKSDGKAEARRGKNGLLEVEPPCISISSFTPGLIYTRRCRLVNKSDRLVRGRVVVPSGPVWAVDLSGEVMLSPGLAVEAAVTFSPVDHHPESSCFSVVLSHGPKDSRQLVVPLTAVKPPPLLQGFGCGGDKEEGGRKCLRAGVVLCGSTRTDRFTLTNIGASADFTISPYQQTSLEQVWDEGVESSVVVSGCVQVAPRQFRLKEGEDVELIVKLEPLTAGTLSYWFAILSDMLTHPIVFYVEFDSVLFSPQQIQFLDELMVKDYSVSVEDDSLTEYYVDFGAMFPSCLRRTKRCTVTNMSPVQVVYRWRRRRVCPLGSGFLEAEDRWLRVEPASGYLLPGSSQLFEIVCRLDGAPLASYKAVFSLIIDNLARECLVGEKVRLLEDDPEQISTNQHHRECQREAVSLIRGEVELWLSVVLPFVTVSPPQFLITCDRLPHVEELAVRVENESSDAVTVDWDVEPCSHLTIVKVESDKEGEIKEGCSQCFIVEVNCLLSSASPSDSVLSSKLLCVVNEGEKVVEVQVEVRKRSDGAETNTSSCHWDLVHLAPSSWSDGLKALRGRVDESVRRDSTAENAPGDLSRRRVSAIMARLQDSLMTGSAVEGGVVCGLMERGEKASWVVCDIRTCHCQLSESSLYLSLFTQVHHQVSIDIINASIVPTYYRWSECLGTDREMLKVWVSSSEGQVAGKSRTGLTVFIYPLQPGDIRDAELRCHVEQMSSPLVLQLRGRVAPLSVLLEWSNNSSNFSVVWPNGGSERSLFISPHLENHSQARFDKLKSLERCGWNETVSETVVPDTRAANDAYVVAAAEVAVATTRSECDSDVHCVVSGSSDSFQCRGEPAVFSKPLEPPHYPRVLTGTTDYWTLFDYPETKTQQRSHQTHLFSLRRSALHFDISAPKIETRVVRVENLTEVKTSVSCKVETFSDRDYCAEYPEDVERHHHLKTGKPSVLPTSCSFYLGVKNKDYPSAKGLTGSRKFGMNLQVEPNHFELTAYKKVEVRVTCDGDVWGEYTDALLVEVKGLPVCVIPITASVRAPPVSFSFHPGPDPYFKFGDLSINEEVKHKVTLINNTYVPVIVSWQIYNKIPVRQSGWCCGEDEAAFSLAVDLHNPNAGGFCRLGLLPYLGSLLPGPFQISGRVVHLEPYGKAVLTLSVCASDKDIQRAEGGRLEATCVGLVHEDPVHWMKWRKLAHRPTGLSQPVLLALSARIQDPVLKVLVGGSPVNRICFKDVLVGDLVESSGYRERMGVCVKNCSGVEAKLSLLVEPPFHLDLTKMGMSRDSHNLIAMPPHSHIQFDVILEMSGAEVEEDVVVSVWEEGDAPTDSKSSELTLQQPLLDKSQTVRLDYKMVYPWLVLSPTRLVFGPVLIDHTAVKRLTIKALSGRERFRVVKGLKASCGEWRSSLIDDQVSAFSVQPERGVLERNQYLDLHVYFTPTESTDYLEVLKIKSSVEGLETLVVMEGVGTWNHKFLPPSQCLPPLPADTTPPTLL